MSLNHIDSIQELKAERKRLQLEAEFAQHALLVKLDQTFNKGKGELQDRLSVPKTVAAVASLGAQHLASSPSAAHQHISNPLSLFSDFQSGLQAYQEKSSTKWLAFLPLLIKLTQFWLTRQKSTPSPA